MKVVECVLIEDCLAPKRVGKMISKKGFRAGQRVRGVATNIALTPDAQVMALKTKDGYIIPEPFLNVIGEVQPNGGGAKASDDIEYAEVIEGDSDSDKESRVVKAAKTAYGSIKASEIIGKTAMRSKYTINFALTGGAIALVYAMLKSKNKFIFAAIGVVIGGMAGNYYGKKIKENESESEN